LLIVAVAAGPAVDKVIDGEMLDLLGPDGVIVNIARGSVVDETALVAALEQGRIAGAGLDVFAAEPFVPEGLQRLDQVVLAPHQGSATREGRAEMAALVIANLDAHFAGDALPSPLI
jgi:lactate dehydrogenase-like 2-hydroxyacid dehydrogenase